jgi:hypothetical protein
MRREPITISSSISRKQMMFRNAVHRRYDQRHLLSNSSGMTHALSTLQPPSRVLTDNDVSRRGHRGSRCAHLNMFGRAPPGPLRLRGSSWSGRPHRPRSSFGDGSMVESKRLILRPSLGERYCNRKQATTRRLYGTVLEPQTTNIEIGTNAPRDTTRTAV